MLAVLLAACDLGVPGALGGGGGLTFAAFAFAFAAAAKAIALASAFSFFFSSFDFFGVLSGLGGFTVGGAFVGAALAGTEVELVEEVMTCGLSFNCLSNSILFFFCCSNEMASATCSQSHSHVFLLCPAGASRDFVIFAANTVHLSQIHP